MGPLTITSPYAHSRVDFNTFTMAILGNPMPESTLILCQSRLYPPSVALDLASGISRQQLDSEIVLILL